MRSLTRRVEGHAPIDLGGREMNEPHTASLATLDQRYEVGVVRVDHLDGGGRVECWIAQRGEREDHVAPLGDLRIRPGCSMRPARGNTSGWLVSSLRKSMSTASIGQLKRATRRVPGASRESRPHRAPRFAGDSSLLARALAVFGLFPFGGGVAGAGAAAG